MYPNRTPSLAAKLAVVGIALLMVAGICTAEGPATKSEDRDALKKQLQEQQEMIEQLEQRLTYITTEVTGKEPPKKPKDPCPKEVVTFVRNWQGNSCDTYQAEIAGWSSACVKECDQKVRLQAAVAGASQTCKEFCNSPGCKPWRYDPPQQCAAYTCAKGKKCAPVCPFLEECFLEQFNTRWNCMCIEL